MSYPRSDLFNDSKANSSLVGSIVVKTDSVSFYSFKANSTYVVKSHGPMLLLRQTDDQEGCVEQEPMEILETINKCINKVVVPSGNTIGLKMVAVGVTSHRSSMLAWDRWTGHPLCNVIMRSDNRATEIVNEYLQIYDKYKFQTVCGLPLSPLFSAFKIKWLLNNNTKVQVAYEQGRCYFGTVDTWIVWNLTGGTKGCIYLLSGGVFATDSSNASNTFLMNINTLQWDPKLLKMFGISQSSLPEIRSSSQIYGKFADGPLKNIPISGVIGNRQAALVGHRCFRRGITKATLDEGGSVFTVTGENKVFSKNGLLTTIGYHIDTRPVYALEGPITSGGAGIEWMEHITRLKTNKITHCLKAGKRINNPNSICYIHAINGLYAPHWRPEALGVLVADEFNAEDMLRAAMESVSFQTAEILKAATMDLKIPIDRIKVDGYLADNKFIMESLADFINAKVEVAMCKEMTALGAAMVAGYAPEVNVWNVMCMAEDVSIANYKPTLKPDELKKRWFDWNRNINRCYNLVDTIGRSEAR
ncbi:Carbohydrate kinase, FGGY, N-terminal,Carbohydrate kinase, FGGY, C- [Cinara cedri]|uniref:Carbohydrate kinase, FGGY, N-terminal,Carbohydrate kinase, FGGY, C n=1 Tax=Cinara cedri TaxID=506608 RepID=A0A5E4MHU0_9HEMI|nr:Carbohydrate kinase, FGGY, N-terminal,Carbohydrate kinase, FGGY, C- [Cinara cedri]